MVDNDDDNNKDKCIFAWSVVFPKKKYERPKGTTYIVGMYERPGNNGLIVVKVTKNRGRTLVAEMEVESKDMGNHMIYALDRSAINLLERYNGWIADHDRSIKRLEKTKKKVMFNRAMMKKLEGGGGGGKQKKAITEKKL